MGTLGKILSDLAEQTSVSKLEQQLEATLTELKTARQHQIEFASLESLLERKRELENDITDLKTSLKELQIQLAAEPDLKQQQAQLAAELEALSDPRAHIRLLNQKLQQQPKLQAQVQEIQASLATIQRTIAQIDGQLTDVATLQEELQTQQSLKDQHRETYQEYLAYRELANTRKERQKQLGETVEQVNALQQELNGALENRDRLAQTFDPIHFQTVQNDYQETNTRQIALSARLPEMLKYQEALDQQLIRLQTLQEKRTLAESELKRKRKIQHFIKFARDAYKKPDPVLQNGMSSGFPGKPIACFENCSTVRMLGWNGRGITN